VVVSAASLGLFISGSDLYVALTTGVAQRLSNTPKYTRSENPGMFWALVIFFASSVLLFAGLLAAVIVHWDYGTNF